MAGKITIDYVNKLFIVKAGVTEIDVAIDLYSDWKEDVKPTVDDQLGSPIAMRVIGGDAISDTQNAGATFFMVNGWKIRPDEANHTLTITGNLFSDPTIEEIVVPTLGTFTVLIKQFVSNLVDSSVSRLDLTQVLQAVYLDTTNGTAGTAEGVGTPTNPSNNIADTTTIMIRDKLSQIVVVASSITLAQAYTNITFIGQGAEFDTTIDLGGQNVGGCKFVNLHMAGTMAGRIQAEKCGFEMTAGVDGAFIDCGFHNDFSLGDDSVSTFTNCYSEIVGALTPVITAGTNCMIAFRNYSGGVELKTLTSGCIVSVDLDPGNLIINADSTGGILSLKGVGSYVNNGTGLTVNTDSFLDTKRNSIAVARLIEQLVTNPTTGFLELWEGGVLVWKWPLTTADGLTAYDGTFSPDKRGVRVAGP